MHTIDSVLGRVSQPARAVWIEILQHMDRNSKNEGHSLRGLCGLKCVCAVCLRCCPMSQPARAVWIEISAGEKERLKQVCHSLRGLCGLKYQRYFNNIPSYLSQPARAVWIEIYCKSLFYSNVQVTACEGCVD